MDIKNWTLKNGLPAANADAQKLADWLRALGLTQSKGARVLGVAQQTLSRYIAGTARVPDGVLRKIERIVS